MLKGKIKGFLHGTTTALGDLPSPYKKQEKIGFVFFLFM
jgi:hypothetical protein